MALKRWPIIGAACNNALSDIASGSTRAVSTLRTLAGSAAQTAGSRTRFSPGQAQHAALCEGAEDILGEQRVALGLFRHWPDERLGRPVDADPRLGEVADFARRRRPSGNMLSVYLIARRECAG
jgi:hypothetical protein